MKYLFIPLVAAMFLFAACSDDSSETTVTLPSGGNLNGTWAGECVDDGGDGAMQTVTFGDGSGSYTYDVWFDDTECSTATSNFTYAGTITYTLGDTVTLDSGEDVTQTVVLDTTQTGTTNDDDTTAEFNSFGAYDISDWETGVAQDVFGVETNGDTYDVEESKDILYVDADASPNTLQFGDETSTGSDGYPDALVDQLLTKQ